MHLSLINNDLKRGDELMSEELTNLVRGAQSEVNL